VRRLEEAVRKSPREHRLGRRRQPAFYRAARAVIAALAPKGPAFEELERVAELPAEHAEKLYRDLTDAAERLERLLSHLRPKGVATFRERVAHASAQAARRSWGGPRAAIRAASGQSR
jgi:hypothetical protein